jgi:hypothetical protein
MMRRMCIPKITHGSMKSDGSVWGGSGKGAYLFYLLIFWTLVFLPLILPRSHAACACDFNMLLVTSE